MKGVSPAVLLLVLFVVIVLAVVAIYAYQTYLAAIVAVPTAAVEYDGEFKDGFLATKGNFINDFTEQSDCAVSNNVLSCTYRSTIAWNATAEPTINSRDWYFAWVADIDGPVRKIDVDFDLQNTGETLRAADDAMIVDAGIYTHENNPRKLFDLTPYIRDGNEIRATTGALQEGEYVFYIHLRTKAVSPDATTGDDIGILRLRLGTKGDVDRAIVTLESA